MKKLKFNDQLEPGRYYMEGDNHDSQFYLILHATTNRKCTVLYSTYHHIQPPIEDYTAYPSIYYSLYEIDEVEAFSFIL